MKFKISQNYNSEEVRQLLEIARGRPASIMDVDNISRPHKAMAGARVRRGVYRRSDVIRVVQAILRQRLCAQLGRISPRYPDVDVEIACPQCGETAVQWESRWLCENGHSGNS